VSADVHRGEVRIGAGSRWEELCAFSDTYTCYSSAVASWAAGEREEWAAAIDPGLTLRILDAGEGLFGFVHFPPGLRAELGLVRVSCDGPPAAAVEGVLAELQRSGRVVVAGDGFRLPWHVAHGRRHVPHWYVLSGTPARPEAIDPFACRNELGVQQAARLQIAPEQLAQALPALPGGDPVLELRERLALGDDCRERERGAYEWFVRGEAADAHAPQGTEGAEGVRVLARAMRERAQDPGAYLQADDIWSIARHRAFLARHAADVALRTADGELATWVAEQVEPLAKRWSHMAPLIMQARMALSAGRAASQSVADTLDDLAGLEQAAADALPGARSVESLGGWSDGKSREVEAGRGEPRQ
jgi:hypothetical protein